MTPQDRLKKIEERAKGYVCLVPKPNAQHTITCHEYSAKICDCDVLWLIARVKKLTEALSYPNRRHQLSTFNVNGQLDDTLAMLQEWLEIARKTLEEEE